MKFILGRKMKNNGEMYSRIGKYSLQKFSILKKKGDIIPDEQQLINREIFEINKVNSLKGNYKTNSQRNNLINSQSLNSNPVIQKQHHNSEIGLKSKKSFQKKIIFLEKIHPTSSFQATKRNYPHNYLVILRSIQKNFHQLALNIILVMIQQRREPFAHLFLNL